MVGLSKTLQEAIENNDVLAIHSSFYSILHEDPNFSTGKFEKTLAYIKVKNIPGVFQEYDGEVFKESDEWNEEYWALEASVLMDNFCMERINLLKQIGRKLYPVAVKKEKVVARSNNKRHDTNFANRKNSSNKETREAGRRKNKNLFDSVKKIFLK